MLHHSEAGTDETGVSQLADEAISIRKIGRGLTMEETPHRACRRISS
jgi:hypothetical protein